VVAVLAVGKAVREETVELLEFLTPCTPAPQVELVKPQVEPEGQTQVEAAVQVIVQMPEQVDLSASVVTEDITH
jgi:hypothetical protein